MSLHVRRRPRGHVRELHALCMNAPASTRTNKVHPNPMIF